MDNDEENQLPALTDKQMAFVLAKQKGMNNSDAYRACTDTSRMAPQTIWADAGKMVSHPKVSLWLSQIRVEQISQATYTLEAHLADMARIKELAIEKGNLSAATKACENLGKAMNHYTSNIEINHTRSADTDLLQQLEKLLGKDASQEAAKRMGYTVENKELH